MYGMDLFDRQQTLKNNVFIKLMWHKSSPETNYSIPPRRKPWSALKKAGGVCSQVNLFLQWVSGTSVSSSLSKCVLCLHVVLSSGSTYIYFLFLLCTVLVFVLSLLSPNIVPLGHIFHPNLAYQSDTFCEVHYHDAGKIDELVRKGKSGAEEIALGQLPGWACISPKTVTLGRIFPSERQL